MWDQNKEKLGVTGHRGCKAYMPENTLISFREAFRLGVDVLEFDIQLTRDDVMIVMHDEMVDRTTDGTGAVWFKTLEEMKALDAGVKFGYPGERVPTFEETLECIKMRLPRTWCSTLRSRSSVPAWLTLPSSCSKNTVCLSAR